MNIDKWAKVTEKAIDLFEPVKDLVLKLAGRPTMYLSKPPLALCK